MVENFHISSLSNLNNLFPCNLPGTLAPIHSLLPRMHPLRPLYSFTHVLARNKDTLLYLQRETEGKTTNLMKSYAKSYVCINICSFCERGPWMLTHSQIMCKARKVLWLLSLLIFPSSRSLLERKVKKPKSLILSPST